MMAQNLEAFEPNQGNAISYDGQKNHNRLLSGSRLKTFPGQSGNEASQKITFTGPSNMKQRITAGNVFNPAPR